MSEMKIMRTHPVPGTVVKEWVIPAREYAAFMMRRGQVWWTSGASRSPTSPASTSTI
jgi:hypothetical protein